LAVSVFFGADEGAKGGVKIKSIRFQNSVSGSGLVVFLTFFFVLWVWYFPSVINIILSFPLYAGYRI
jgi:hypothetical protein